MFNIIDIFPHFKLKTRFIQSALFWTTIKRYSLSGTTMNWHFLVRTRMKVTSLLGSSSLNMTTAWEMRLPRMELYWLVVLGSSVDLMQAPSYNHVNLVINKILRWKNDRWYIYISRQTLLTTTVPMTPLCPTSRFSVSSTSAAICTVTQVNSFWNKIFLSTLLFWT